MGKFIYKAVLTTEEDGGYSVEFPDLPGCFTCGDDYMETVAMAADAAKTYVASLLLHGEPIPEPGQNETPAGCEGIFVFFEADASYIVEGPVISAAQAARELGVSPARVTHMIDAGILQGYRRGRRTYVSTRSVEDRRQNTRKAGRPRKDAAQA